jgi:hypothetical protein
MANKQITHGALWAVVGDDGRMSVYGPGGEKIIGEYFCRVQDGLNELPSVIYKGIVNIASSVEDMKMRVSDMEIESRCREVKAEIEKN